jgi:hypothetical protein
MKYFGFLRFKAATLPGSRVSVAENNSFWHEDTFVSSTSVRKSDSLWRCKKAGERPSAYGIAYEGNLERPVAVATKSGIDRTVCDLVVRVAART